jgi:hypothetical protein
MELSKKKKRRRRRRERCEMGRNAASLVGQIERTLRRAIAHIVGVNSSLSWQYPDSKQGDGQWELLGEATLRAAEKLSVVPRPGERYCLRSILLS